MRGERHFPATGDVGERLVPQVDRHVGVGGYDSWWDVHVAEVSEMPAVQEARKAWEVMRAKERHYC